MLLCEGCGVNATHWCSGLDVPALAFCVDCALFHERTCHDVKSGASTVVRMTGAGSVAETLAKERIRRLPKAPRSRR